MKRSINAFIAHTATLIAVALLLLASQQGAVAQGYPSAQSVNARIPVLQIFTTNVSGVKSRFDYVLEAQTPSAPMPDGSSEGEYAFSMEGSVSSELTICADKIGRSLYTLFQCVGDAQKGYHYDRSVYWITVDVYQDTQGQFRATVVMQPEGGAKVSVATFQNSYSWQLPVTPPGDGGSVKTGDSNNSAFYIVLMIAALAGLVALKIWMRGPKDGKQKGDAGHEK